LSQIKAQFAATPYVRLETFGRRLQGGRWVALMCESDPIVLVVDDDPAVRDALKFSLELEGLRVHTCASGAELLDHPALAQARCVVLDYRMPIMDGFQVLDSLAERGIRLPTILITTSVTDGIRARARKAGIAHVLEKPLLDGTLMDRLKELTR
jgi:FixJ family two-component response regulator